MGMNRQLNDGGKLCSFLSITLVVVVLSIISAPRSRVAMAQTTPLTNETSYTPATNVWINCGGGNATVGGIGTFVADNNGAYISQGILATNSAPTNDDDDPYPELLEDARLFLLTSTYKIPVAAPGRVWLRLWFYPITYVQSGQQTYTPSSALFSVIANEFTLLSNLSAATIQSGATKYMFVEYIINVQESSMSITFKPEPNMTAFVNALAVVSVPDDLLSSQVIQIPQATIISLPNALQTMYRLNVGGGQVTPVNDSFLTREWDTDIPYVYGAIKGVVVSPVPSDAIIYPAGVPKFTAPGSVYGTARTLGAQNSPANLTWLFPVNPGYAYLVRLHFAELVYNTINQRVFNIFLNNQTAYVGYDAVAAAGGEPDAASFRDFVVDMYDETMVNLWLVLSPALGTSSQYANAILNGLEIFKAPNQFTLDEK